MSFSAVARPLEAIWNGNNYDVCAVESPSAFSVSGHSQETLTLLLLLKVCCELYCRLSRESNVTGRCRRGSERLTARSLTHLPAEPPSSRASRVEAVQALRRGKAAVSPCYHGSLQSSSPSAFLEFDDLKNSERWGRTAPPQLLLKHE